MYGKLFSAALLTSFIGYSAKTHQEKNYDYGKLHRFDWMPKNLWFFGYFDPKNLPNMYFGVYSEDMKSLGCKTLFNNLLTKSDNVRVYDDFTVRVNYKNMPGEKFYSNTIHVDCAGIKICPFSQTMGIIRDKNGTIYKKSL